MQIDQGRTRIDKIVQPTSDVASSVRLILLKKLERQNFQSGTLRLACVAHIPNLPLTLDFRTEVVATLAARNQRLAQELPRRYLNACGSHLYPREMIVVVLLFLMGFHVVF